jgi:hypothetical protein
MQWARFISIQAKTHHLTRKHFIHPATLSAPTPSTAAIGKFCVITCGGVRWVLGLSIGKSSHGKDPNCQDKTNANQK